jgi:propionate CoA-transferase
VEKLIRKEPRKCFWRKYMDNKFTSAKNIAGMIKNNSVIATVGMSLISASETILKAIEKRYLETAEPNNLTLIHSAGQSDRERGIQHFAHKGLVTRLIGSHWGLQPKWMEMIHNNEVAAYCLPQGQIALWFREIGAGLPGRFSKVGLNTFIDPRIEGGKMNEITKELEDLTEIIQVRGEEYLFYPEIKIDYVIIRGTYADENGNLTTDEEPMKLEVFPAVMAAKRFGGKVIAQVKRVVKNGTLHPKKVVVPGTFIDHIVICDNPEVDHRQTSSWYFDPAYCGDVVEPENKTVPMPLNIRKVIGRRALLCANRGDIINLGTGIPNDVIGSIVSEEKISKDIIITVESGIYGGVQAGGVDFGIGKNIFAMVSHDEQMVYYNGAGVDVTFMGAGEMDKNGNVNATKLGKTPTGAGGFIDITQNAKHVVFCSTFTAKGLKTEYRDRKLNIVKEGSIKKLVNEVRQISYNGRQAAEKGQKMHFVTERAVFELSIDGPILIEIADGVDLEKDILEQMEFRPKIAQNLKSIDPDVFSVEMVGLKNKLK